MRLVPFWRLEYLPADEFQAFFIQHWYSMVHNKAIDSHRPRSMYSLNILEELYYLTQKIGQLPVYDDIEYCVSEAIYLVEKDYTLNKYFTFQVKRILPCLIMIRDEIQKEKKEKEKKEKKEKNKKEIHVCLNLCQYYIREFIDCRAEYLSYLLDDIEYSIFSEKNYEKIYYLTRNLLSCLIHEGHTFEYLFSLVNIILVGKTLNGTDFPVRYQRLKDYLKQDTKEYNVVLRLEGWKNQELLPTEISSNIKLIGDIPSGSLCIKEEHKEKIVSFITPPKGSLFAQVKIEAKDARSAGVNAKDSILYYLDLIRFELEKETISINPLFLSTSSESKYVRIFRLPSGVPNPQRKIDRDEFDRFLVSTGSIYDIKRMQEESSRRIKSAFRFYRMGRDSINFENKYLNWWTGLEYLLRLEGGPSIISDVSSRIIPILVLNYLQKFLECYRSTLVTCRINLSEQSIEKYGVDSIDKLNTESVFDLIMNDIEYANIETALLKYPIVLYHLKWFRHSVKDDKSIVEFLDRHDNGLKCHIKRLWRVRNDIVHSAKYNINLTLICANLEYYIKTLLYCILDQFERNHSISSLKEFYDRIENTYKNVKNELTTSKRDTLNQILMNNIA